MGLFKLGFIGQANPTYMWHLEPNAVNINTFKMEKFIAAATGTTAAATAWAMACASNITHPSSSEHVWCATEPAAAADCFLQPPTVTKRGRSMTCLYTSSLRHHYVMDSVTRAKC